MSQKKNPKWDRAVVALLSEATITAAAKKASVSRRQLTRWLDDDDFQAVLHTARDRAFGLAIGRLIVAANKAVTVMVHALDGKDVSRIQLSAAQNVLQYAFAGKADEAEARIMEIEAKLNELLGAMQ